MLNSIFDQSEAWALETLMHFAQIWHQKWALKEFKLHPVYAVVSKAIKPWQLVGQAAEFKLESKFEPLQVIWRSLQMLFQKVIKGLEGKINGNSLGAALWHCLGEHKYRVFLSLLQSLRAATGLLEEHMLPLLQYWLSSRVKKVLMLCKFWAATSHFF